MYQNELFISVLLIITFQGSIDIKLRSKMLLSHPETLSHKRHSISKYPSECFYFSFLTKTFAYWQTGPVEKHVFHTILTIEARKASIAECIILFYGKDINGNFAKLRKILLLLSFVVCLRKGE